MVMRGVTDLGVSLGVWLSGLVMALVADEDVDTVEVLEVEAVLEAQRGAPIRSHNFISLNTISSLLRYGLIVVERCPHY